MVVLASVAESVFDWVMERKQDLGTFSLVRGCIFAVAFSFSCFFVHSGPGDSSYGLLLPFDVLSSCSCFVLSGPGDSSFVLSLHVLVLFRVNVFFSSSSCGLLLMRLYPDDIIPFLGQITFWVI